MKKVIVIAFFISAALFAHSCNNDAKTGNENMGPSETDSANVAPSDSTGRTI